VTEDSPEINSLTHVAIIMDGNGRWAKQQNKKTIFGHQEGAKTLQKIVEESVRQKIKFLTVYAFSSENWLRPKDEVESLMGLMRHMLKNEVKKLYKQNIKLKIIGDRSLLPKDLQDLIQKVEKKSEKNDALTVVMAISYGAHQEILNAVKKVSEQVSKGHLQAEEITQDVFSNFLETKDIPDPDLLIRTSGEQRISNFLLWQCAYTEFYFTPVLWPDFNETEYQKAIETFYGRKRRFGLRE
tara:strand:- start:29325 stop:30047 length:723 start_codon:yes stop_codon:yes gene_type:complete